MQLGELQTTAKRMQGLFADWHFYGCGADLHRRRDELRLGRL